jgi:hypothetical protein
MGAFSSTKRRRAPSPVYWLLLDCSWFFMTLMSVSSFCFILLTMLPRELEAAGGEQVYDHYTAGYITPPGGRPRANCPQKPESIFTHAMVSNQVWLRFGRACRRTEHFIQLHLPVFWLPFLEAVPAEEHRFGRWVKVRGEILPVFRLLAE